MNVTIWHWVFCCRLNSSTKINFSITYISIFLFMTDTNFFHIDFAHVFYIDKLFSKAFEFSLFIEELTYQQSSFYYDTRFSESLIENRLKQNEHTKNVEILTSPCLFVISHMITHHSMSCDFVFIYTLNNLFQSLSDRS